MGLFDYLFSRREKKKELNAYWKTLTAYRPAFRSWSGNLYENELVRSAIDARARHNSKLKVEVIGSAKPSLRTRLEKKPNDFQTWSQFLYRTSTILDMQSTAFLVPILDARNEPAGVASILPTQCEILQTESGDPWLRYRFSDNRTAAVELQRCGILTRYQYRDDIFGTANTALTDTMKLIDIQNQGIQEAVKNSAAYRFMAQSNNFAKSADLAKERQRFSMENFGAEAEGGGLLLFPNTYTNVQQIKSTPYTVDPDQAKIIKDNVFDYFGVNEDILQNKAYGDLWSAFYEGCIEVFSIQLSEVMTKMFYTDTEQSFGARIMATANRLQYLSNSDKLKVSSQMADRGIMTINEIREIWNLAPIEGGDVATIRGEYYTRDEDGDSNGSDGED